MSSSCSLCGGETERRRRSPAAGAPGAGSGESNSRLAANTSTATSSQTGVSRDKMLAVPLHSHDSQQWHQPVDAHIVPEQIKTRTAARFDETRYRPREHFQVPHGWMNDSIGPVYCKQTGLYHVFCQWNPMGTEWGNMSWAHAVSPDLVHWQPYGEQPALKPDQSYDKEGVFTGCFVPRGPHGEEDILTIIYTSVSDPNIHWTLDYNYGSETLSMATSRDGGKTWQKHAQNPLREGPPKSLKVTGWRDPQLSSLPCLDRLLGRQPGECLYGTISGGIAGGTPSPFLYSVPTNDLYDWQELGQLCDVGSNGRLDDKWCPEFGRNFECSTLAEMEGNPVLLTNTEGGSRRWSVWAAGDLSLQEGRPRFTPTTAGVLDWGAYYAASVGQSKDGRTLVMGWLTEDDLTVAQRKSQGWAGMSSLPREVSPISYTGVTGSLKSPLSRLRCFEQSEQADGTFTLSTIVVRPAQELLCLRETALVSQVADLPMYPYRVAACLPLSTQTWELEIDVDLLPSCSSTTIKIQHSAEEYTRIIFSLADETITIDREESTLSHDVQTSPEIGSHTLLQFGEKREYLSLRIFFDVSAIEVYANDRFAMSSRVYPASIGPMAVSISAAAASRSSGPVGRIVQSAVWQR